jgi:hypothetical protein
MSRQPSLPRRRRNLDGRRGEDSRAAAADAARERSGPAEQKKRQSKAGTNKLVYIWILGNPQTTCPCQCPVSSPRTPHVLSSARAHEFLACASGVGRRAWKKSSQGWFHRAGGSWRNLGCGWVGKVRYTERPKGRDSTLLSRSCWGPPPHTNAQEMRHGARFESEFLVAQQLGTARRGGGMPLLPSVRRGKQAGIPKCLSGPDKSSVDGDVCCQRAFFNLVHRPVVHDFCTPMLSTPFACLEEGFELPLGDNLANRQPVSGVRRGGVVLVVPPPSRLHDPSGPIHHSSPRARRRLRRGRHNRRGETERARRRFGFLTLDSLSASPLTAAPLCPCEVLPLGEVWVYI